MARARRTDASEARTSFEVSNGRGSMNCRAPENARGRRRPETTRKLNARFVLEIWNSSLERPMRAPYQALPSLVIAVSKKTYRTVEDEMPRARRVRVTLTRVERRPRTIVPGNLQPSTKPHAPTMTDFTNTSTSTRRARSRRASPHGARLALCLAFVVALAAARPAEAFKWKWWKWKAIATHGHSTDGVTTKHMHHMGNKWSGDDSECDDCGTWWRAKKWHEGSWWGKHCRHDDGWKPGTGLRAGTCMLHKCGWELKKCRLDMTCREAVQCAIGAFTRSTKDTPSPPRRHTLTVPLGTSVCSSLTVSRFARNSRKTARFLGRRERRARLEFVFPFPFSVFRFPLSVLSSCRALRDLTSRTPLALPPLQAAAWAATPRPARARSSAR